MSAIKELIKKYECNEPIILKDVKLNGISDISIRQTFSRMAKQGQIKRYEQGIYYIPSKKSGESKISARRVYEKKYICDEGEVYGFYSGHILYRQVGIKSKTPDIIEIVTNKQKSRMRKIENCEKNIIVRRARVKINADNVKTLQFLELINSLDIKKLSKEERVSLDSYMKKQNLKKDEVAKYISKYPVKVARDLIESGAFLRLT